MQGFANWLQKRFANTELVVLVFSILFLAAIFMLAGKILAPVVVSVILAYLLDVPVKKLESWGLSHTLAVSIIFTLLTIVFILSLIFLLPLIWKQFYTLASEIPNMIKKGQIYFQVLSHRYPDYISTIQIKKLTANYQADLTKMGHVALLFSLSTLNNIMIVVIYLILVPLLVFFLMKDKKEILSWFSIFVPKKRRLISQVWSEVNQQMGNYIRAKVLEIIIVGVIAAVIFILFGLNYAILLGLLAGLSVLIPYVGVAVVSIPVLIIALLQWGLTAHFFYLILCYGIWMGIDGNILAPLLFSETLKIHPVAVIVAILVFGALWGFWGVFFAIPLATVVKAVLNASFKAPISALE